MLQNVLFAIAASLLGLALDYSREKTNFNFKESVKKYAAVLIAVVLLSLFIDEPIMQNFFMVLAVLGGNRLLKGLDKVQQNENTATRMVYGSSISDKWNTVQWFHFTVIFAFASTISFFHNYSAVADKYHLNGFFGFVGIGIVFGLIAIYGLYKTATTSDGGKDSVF